MYCTWLRVPAVSATGSGEALDIVVPSKLSVGLSSLSAISIGLGYRDLRALQRAAMAALAPDDDAVSREFTDDVRHAFEEDRVILNAVQVGMDSSATPTIDLKNDLASHRFRQTLARMIAAAG
jgi:hypothetical protein